MEMFETLEYEVTNGSPIYFKLGQDTIYNYENKKISYFFSVDLKKCNL